MSDDTGVTAPEGSGDEGAATEHPLVVPDDVLLGAVDVARAALAEITSPESVGAPAGHIVEGERVLSLLFENRLAGYPGWYWTVSLSREPGSSQVNVLEAELMPGDGALLAPEWVPWADRLAEYQAQRKAEREAAAAAGEPEPEDEFVADDEDEDESEEGDEDFDDDDLEVVEEDDDFDEAEELQGAEQAALED